MTNFGRQTNRSLSEFLRIFFELTKPWPDYSGDKKKSERKVFISVVCGFFTEVGCENKTEELAASFRLHWKTCLVYSFSISCRLQPKTGLQQPIGRQKKSVPKNNKKKNAWSPYLYSHSQCALFEVSHSKSNQQTQGGKIWRNAWLLDWGKRERRLFPLFIAHARISSSLVRLFISVGVASLL